jgi:hypothetical protein
MLVANASEQNQPPKGQWAPIVEEVQAWEVSKGGDPVKGTPYSNELREG